MNGFWTSPRTLIAVTISICIFGIVIIVQDVVFIKQIRIVHVFSMMYLILSTWQIVCHYMGRLANEKKDN